MTVEQHNVVDFVATDPQTHKVSLIVSDHLSWDRVNEHLFHLQEKLNGYFKFVESGELIQKFPAAADQPIAIVITLKYPVPEQAEWFFEKARKSSEAAGFELTWRLL